MCLTMTIVIFVRERSVFMEIIIADIVEKKRKNFYTIDVGLYDDKDVTVALNIPHDLTAIGYRHYYIHKPRKKNNNLTNFVPYNNNQNHNIFVFLLFYSNYVQILNNKYFLFRHITHV